MSNEDKGKLLARREGVLELCHNWGTGNLHTSCLLRSQLIQAESDDSFKGYASGNDDVGKGFGHICVAVDNLEAAVKRFDEQGVKFKKRPEEGKMRVSQITTTLCDSN
jgi:lactoylglutathione lyase